MATEYCVLSFVYNNNSLFVPFLITYSKLNLEEK